jgi:hypothetical protein
MFGWLVKWSIISLILIFLLHYLYFFFVDTLTVPRTRDLIHKPLERYNEISLLTNKEPAADDMQNELRHFLDNISKKENINTTPIASETENNDYSKF